jgi:hypothetical protein
MVLDFTKFTPGIPPSKDTLTILEEMPDRIHSADMTELFTVIQSDVIASP